METTARPLLALLLAWVAVGCSGDLVRGAPAGPADTADAGPSDTGPSDDRGSADFTDADAADATDATRHPDHPALVLAHGMAGFEHLSDAESLPYFYDLREPLEEAGRDVFTPEVDPFNDSSHRGAQLLDEVEAIVEQTAHERVTLVGHSQGGLDARYVAHHRPELVAAVVTISSPHRGTLIADIALQFVDHPLFRDLVDALVRLFGKPLYDESGEETSLIATLRQFSDPGIEEFNDEITDRDGVYYASIAGRSGGHSGEGFCNREAAPEFLARWHDQRDPVEPIFEIPHRILEGPRDVKRPNDGVLRVSDAEWGEFLGCIPADHLDEVGQLGGDHPGGANAFEYVEFYRDLVDYLEQRGH